MIGKLLVVDDEIWFREGLVQLISSNQLGWEVVGEASDGEEAMLSVELNKPDLIITDINMPVMDGLQFMEWLSHMHPDIKVIILTGYRDFEYAQRALRYGAVEFLLKPFSLDEAYRVLRQAYEELRLKQLNIRLTKQQRQIELFRSALFGFPCERGVRQEWIQQWKGASFYILHIDSYDLPGKNYNPDDIDLLYYAITNIIQELQQRHAVEGIYLPLRKETFAFLFKHEPAVETYHEAVIESVRHFMRLEINWLKLGILEGFDELATQFTTSFNLQGEGVLEDSAAMDSFTLLKEEILSLLITSDLSAVEQRIMEYVERTVTSELQICKMRMYTLVSVLSSILLTDFKHIRAEVTGEDFNPAQILEFRSVQEILLWAREKGADFLSIFKQWLNSQQDDIVYQAKQYIKNQYYSDCSLHAVAAYVHVTPNYLSNLFKRETGIGLTNYVSQLRIEEAKGLLQYTRLKMTEIAERVGFDNSSYFTVVFKQLTGVSPRSYRRQYED